MLQTNYRHKYNQLRLIKKHFSKFCCTTKFLMKYLMIFKKTDFSVPSQHTVIIGQRGQGKTTLLRKLNIEIEEDKQLSTFFDSYTICRRTVSNTFTL